MKSYSNKLNVQSSDKDWSYSSYGDVKRFEVRNGDHWSGDANTPKERSEAYVPDVKFAANETYNISFSMMIEPGAKNTASWMTLIQIQSTFDKGEVGHSPPFAIEMAGERMRIVTRSDTKEISGIADGGYTRLYNDSTDIVRGKWYDFNLQVKFDAFGEGSLVVTRDDIVIVDYKGAIGFNDLVGGYFKHGVYRGEAAENFAVQYKDLEIEAAEDSGFKKFDATGALEKLIGTSGNDLFLSGTGKAFIDGGAGIDVADYRDITASVEVSLNRSIDSFVMIGGAVDDTIRNIENIFGGSGADKLSGDALSNELKGFAGDDILKGGDGKDVLDGGAGVDTVDYSYTSKSVMVALADKGDAIALVGGLAEDTLRSIENIIGGSNADNLIGNAGTNVINGGIGDDILTGLGGMDFLEGSGGIDTATYREKADGIIVTLNNNLAAKVFVGGQAEDELKNIENVDGGKGEDSLTGDSKANALRGFDGDDYLNGGANNDMLDGGTGNDRLEGGVGDDVLIGGAGTDLLYGGKNNDMFRFTAVTDSMPTAMDRIMDFAWGDRVDISAIDANSSRSGDQGFSFVKGFTSHAGELTVACKDGWSTILGDVDGDGRADFGFQINGNITPQTINDWFHL